MKMTIEEDFVALLKQQNEEYRVQIEGYRKQIAQLTTKVSELNGRIESLLVAIKKKEEDISGQKRKSKALAKLNGNVSEKILAEDSTPTPAKPSPKERGNNNSKRKEYHPEKIEIVDVYPDDPAFDIDRAREIGIVESFRYVYRPGELVKIIIRQHNYSQDGSVYRSSAPAAPLLNSNYDGSFIAWMIYLRYIHSMPIERVIKMLREQGVELSKSTAHGLIRKSFDLLDRLSASLREAVLSDSYLTVDETYYRVLVEKEDPESKGSKKGYYWGILANHLKLVEFIYENGSRSGEVIHKTLQSYSGTIHTDGYSTYRKFGSSEYYPNIMRISCIQHCKRKFLDIKEDSDAVEIINLFNELYRQDHKHRVGCDGWTETDHYQYRRKYAPPIFARLRAKLNEINNQSTLLPKSEMAEAVRYALTEMDSMENYIKSGYYHLDTNNIERINRYISLSRKNSLFAGSHAGAKRMALLYSLACSCRQNNINTLEYFTDILNRMGTIQPNAPQEVFRNMLPDRWTKKKVDQ